jgi:ABC-type lipoprotein export system ATPase subunit
MEDALLGEILSRAGGSELDDAAQLLVLAACEGDDQLTSVLGGNALPQPDVSVPEPGDPPGAYLASLAVEGFRGVGTRTALSFSGGPGLTLIVGRNGSGKSSFAEALEVLLTGDNRRWADRSKVWREGWQNLHHTEATSVEARFFVEGEGETTVTRSWAHDVEITEGSASAQVHGKPRGRLANLLWDEPLVSYRPFLSYNELGSMLDEGPSKLYDALASILGLEELVEAEQRLGAERKAREKAMKSAKDATRDLRASLEGNDDERAAICLGAIATQPWDLEAIESAVVGGNDEGSENELDLLRMLSTLRAPVPLDEALALVDRLRGASRGVESVAASASARALSTAHLLRQALAFHDEHDGVDCPVCGTPGVLTGLWQQQSLVKAHELEAAARDASEVESAAKVARADAIQALAPPPDYLARAVEVGIDSATTLARWTAWSDGADELTLEGLATRIEDDLALFLESVEQLRGEARAESDRREDAWRPVAEELAAWCGQARVALTGAEQLDTIGSAEGWLRGVTDELRAARFAPIAAQAKGIWDTLRMQSSVELANVKLEGTATRRRVELQVNVDGTEGAALGVMSQGELHSLALSLFFPRATRPESPFRFVVIDDPVQSMDPARVDGLARVLEDVAKTRQVLVFTHDDRLPQSVRQLGIEASILEVTRRPSSVVEVRPSLDPVRRHLEDAFALASTDSLPPETGRRVVPGFCRLAVEAAFTNAYLRKHLRAGDEHAAIEESLAGADRLTKLAALAMFDDAGKGGDVLSTLNRRLGTYAATAYKACNTGTHHGYDGDLLSLCRDVERLSQQVLEVFT